MIKLHDFSIGYGERTLLCEVETTIEKGRLTALIGRNGTGKSTLLRAIAGLNRRYTGRILLDGHNAADMRAAEMARTLAFVTTERTRIANLKCKDVVAIGRAPYTNFDQLAVLVPSIIAGLLLAVVTIKPLNLLLFGEEYAVTMGLNIRRSRGLLFLSTTLLAGTVTAFCGPIGFIGLAMPHVTRMLFRNSDHRVLVPGTVLSGAAVLLLCDLVSKMFTLPINAITALLGIPIVVWVVLRNKSVTA